MVKVKRSVTDPSEYKRVVRAGEELSLEPVRHDACGAWKTSKGEPVWPSHIELKKVGYKYFHMVIQGELLKCQACWNSDTPGQLEVVLEGETISEA